jgi:hypothetical protein
VLGCLRQLGLDRMLAARPRRERELVVAMIVVHWKNGFFASGNGIELPFLYAAGAVTLALVGPGLFSLDALLGLEWLWTPRIEVLVLAAGIVGALANLLARRVPVPQTATAS